MGTVSTHRVKEPHRCTYRERQRAGLLDGEEAQGLPLKASRTLAQHGTDTMQRTWLPPKRQTNLVGTKNDMVVPTGQVVGLCSSLPALLTVLRCHRRCGGAGRGGQ